MASDQESAMTGSGVDASQEARLGREVMDFLDNCREEYGDGFRFGDVMIVADVIVDGNPVACGSSDPRRWVQIALLKEALTMLEEVRDLEAQIESSDDDD